MWKIVGSNWRDCRGISREDGESGLEERGIGYRIGVGGVGFSRGLY